MDVQVLLLLEREREREARSLNWAPLLYFTTHKREMVLAVQEMIKV